MAQDRRLLRVKTRSGRVAYRLVQFDGRRQLPGVADVVRTLADVADRLTIAAWLTGAHPGLDGDRPVDALREGRREDVLTAARRFGQPWWFASVDPADPHGCDRFGLPAPYGACYLGTSRAAAVLEAFADFSRGLLPAEALRHRTTPPGCCAPSRCSTAKARTRRSTTPTAGRTPAPGCTTTPTSLRRWPASVSRSRGTMSSLGGASAGLMELLAALDGVLTSHTGVVTVATTNKPDGLDPALRRAARFDRVVHLPLPDRALRERILAAYLAPLGLDGDVAAVAARCEGPAARSCASSCASACCVTAAPSPSPTSARSPSRRPGGSRRPPASACDRWPGATSPAGSAPWSILRVVHP